MTQPQRYFRLTDAQEGGLSCDRDGLSIGGVALLAKDLSGTGWSPRPIADINAELSRAYGVEVDIRRKAGGLVSIGKALNEDDVAYAQLVALGLCLPDPPNALKAAACSRKAFEDLARGLDAAGILRKDWDADKHPRWPAGNSDGTGGQSAPADDGGHSSERTDAASTGERSRTNDGGRPPLPQGALDASAMGVDASGGGAGAGSAQPGAAGASTAASNPTPTDILRGGDVWIDDSNAHDEPELPLHSTGARITYQVVNSDGWRVDGSLHSYKIYEKIIAQRVEGPNPPPDWNRSNHDPVDLGNTGEFVDYITFPTGVDRPYTYNSTTIQQFYVSVDGAPPVRIGPQMRQEIDVVNGTATQVHVVEVHP